MEELKKRNQRVNILEKKRNLETLLETIRFSEKDGLRTNAFKTLFRLDFGNYDIFDFLKEHALSDPVPKIRFLATKLLYKKYRKRSRDLVKWKLNYDEVFSIPFIRLDKQERYNFNDLVSTFIQKGKYQSQMVQNIYNTSLLDFFFEWKRYTEGYEVFYEVYLQCFILIHRPEKTIYYLCHAQKNPFTHLKLVKEFSVDFILEQFSLIQKLFTQTSNLTFLRVISEEKANYPSFKVWDSTSGLLCYILEHKKI